MKSWEGKMEENPREKLLRIREELKREKSLKRLRAIVTEFLHCKPSDLEQFSFQIDSHKWRGIIYKKRNYLMGTIFSFFDNKPMIIRGYPKIKYAEESKILGKYCFLEEKEDGTNLGIFLLPNGKLMGKTRMRPNWEEEGWAGRNWKKLFLLTNLEQNILALCKEGYLVFGELFGKLNPGEFIRYSSDISFKVFDIVDLETLSFLPFQRKIQLLREFEIPSISLYCEGYLTPKLIEKVEFELSKRIVEDGIEGVVAKWYSKEVQDQYFCKIKCKDISEKAWAISRSTTIPTAIILKAIRKAKEALQVSDKEKFEKLVLDELREEFSQEMISHSRQKIKRTIYKVFTPLEKDKLEEASKFLSELEKQGIDLSNKGKVLSMMSNKFIGWNPRTLYRCYLNYLSKKGVE